MVLYYWFVKLTKVRLPIFYQTEVHKVDVKEQMTILLTIYIYYVKDFNSNPIFR